MKRWLSLTLVLILSVIGLVNCIGPFVPVPPADPTFPTAVGGVGQVVLDWDQAGVVDFFEVRFRLVGAEARGWGEPQEVGNPPVTVMIEPGIYEWQVRANRAGLYSDWVQGNSFDVVWLTKR